MAYEEFKWRCRDGTSMFACEWSPEARSEAKAVIGIIHGMGEHTGRYAHVAQRFIDEGYIVMMFDQRGHGRTAGQRGHTPDYEQLLEGIDLMLAEAEHRSQGLPIFLYGHSMGGNVTLNYILRRKPQIAGAIVTGPWLQLAFMPPSLQVWLARIVNRVYPSFSNNRPMKADHLTSDPEMARRYREDSLNHGFITARFYNCVVSAGLWALNHANELNVPLLLMHGGNDKVTSIHASQQFAERAGSDRCMFKEWPDFLHELHNDTNREEVISDALHWINQQRASST